MKKLIYSLMGLAAALAGAHATTNVPISVLPFSTAPVSADVFPIYVWTGSNYTVKRITWEDMIAPATNTLQAEALIGTLPDVTFPSVLPAVDGSALTEINFNNLLHAPAGYYVPSTFGAVGNGSTDDTVAISNAIYAVNQTGGKRGIDFVGGVYKLTYPLPAITAGNVKLFNGTLLYHSTNGACLTKNNNKAGDYNDGDNFEVSHVTIVQTLGKPNTNCYGVVLGDGVGYGVNSKLDFVTLTNWWRGVVIDGMAEVHIDNSKIIHCWSNFVFQTRSSSNPDMVRISNTLLHNGESDYDTSAFNKDTIAVQLEGGNKSFTLENVNGGKVKQGFLVSSNSGGAKITIDRVQMERFYNHGGAQTNLARFEFWDSEVRVRGLGSFSGFGDSNYCAVFGIYARTNVGSNLNMDKNEFMQIEGPTFDVWAGQDVRQLLIPQLQQTFTVTTHSTWRDTGTTTIYSFGSLPVVQIANNFEWRTKFGGSYSVIGTPAVNSIQVNNNDASVNLYGTLRMQSGANAYTPWGIVLTNGAGTEFRLTLDANTNLILLAP